MDVSIKSLFLFGFMFIGCAISKSKKEAVVSEQSTQHLPYLTYQKQSYFPVMAAYYGRKMVRACLMVALL
jgi:hypothetical protein